MPSDFFFKNMNTVHRVLLKASGGRIGREFYKMPVLELTTTGRKSGQKRTVMLTSPLRDGKTIVVVASRGGDPQNPAWFLNLREQPDVEVAMAGGPKAPYRARVATAEERAALWPRITADYKNYADYQTKATREIPVVLLDPVTDGQPAA